MVEKVTDEAELARVSSDLALSSYDQSFCSPLLLKGVAASEPTLLYLHGRQKRTCWLLKSLHEYEAWVTRDQPNGPQFPVDEITLTIQRSVDAANYQHRCQNVAVCAKSDEIFKKDACGKSCFAAAATYRGITWTTGAMSCLE